MPDLVGSMIPAVAFAILSGLEIQSLGVLSIGVLSIGCYFINE
jgi:hypothetical protein